MQDTITQLALCAAVGGALSLIVAAALSRSGRNPAIWSVLPRLVVAAGPIYLGADYVRYQGPAAAACAAVTFALGFHALRGWWVPERPASAGRGRAATEQPAPANLAASGAIFYLAGPQRGAAAGAALRSRVLTVVRADRQGERPRDRSMPSAA